MVALDARGNFHVKLPAAHEALGNIGGLQHRTLGRRMGGKIAGDGDQDVPALEPLASCSRAASSAAALDGADVGPLQALRSP